MFITALLYFFLFTCLAQLTRVSELTLAREVLHEVNARAAIHTGNICTVVDF